MADTGIFCTTAQVARKAGANASAVSVAEAYTNDFVSQAEAKINAETNYNWSDAYAGLNADVKGILSEAASNLAAIYVIQYDMGGFSSREEAETMLDVLYALYRDAIKILRDKNQAEFIQDA